MQHILIRGVDPSARDVERLIRRARIARSEFLRHSLRRAFKAIGRTAFGRPPEERARQAIAASN
jgi:hypothetical protein